MNLPNATPTATGQPDIPSVAPWDVHNQAWVRHVHPSEWQNPTPTGRYNLVVIGAGPAGLVTAIGAAGLGAKVALVEKHLMGGDCLNVGCVPSKALIRAARAASEVKHAAQFGVRVPAGTFVDFPAVMERLRRIRADISHHDSAQRFTDQGIDVFLGAGAFTSRNTFEVDGRQLPFAKACIATGARAASPPIKGLDDVPYLTNETLFTLTELPHRIAFIGAGPIGCEMAQAFRRFGSEVTLVTTDGSILKRDDPEAAEIVKQSLIRDGVDVRSGGLDLEVSRGEGGIRLAVEHPDHDWSITVDQLVVAAGRAPNVENLGLDHAAVDIGRHGIVVDDFLRSTNPNIFAAGDVASKVQFTRQLPRR